jgi:hypothetical protein
MTTATMPVQTEVIEVRGNKIKVEYSIKARIPASKSEVKIYSVNGVPGDNPEDAAYAEIRKAILDHEANIEKESLETNGDDFADVKATLDEDSDRWDDYFQNQENN